MTQRQPRGEVSVLGVIKDAKGRVVFCPETAFMIMTRHPDWAGAVRLNEFEGREVLVRRVPGSEAGDDELFPREIREADFTAAQRWFNRAGHYRASRAVIADAMVAAANAAPFDPLKAYLQACRWDGVPRLERWLVDYCGAQDVPFAREAGKRWMISAVARAMEPGCKVDAVLVLEGAQGTFKSSALRMLAGPEFFGDALPPPATKDASEYLRGRWIVEIAELAAFRRSEAEAIKAFLSRTEERYRPAYGRTLVTQPRRCVFAGTTNRFDWLDDDTGGRRFWPVRVGQIDLNAIERDRDLLWAEAVERFDEDEAWWLPPDLEAAARAEQSTRHGEDPWLADVARFIEARADVSCRAVLAHLGIEIDRRTRADSDRVVRLLHRLGWERLGQFTAGDEKGQARFAPVEGR